MNRKTTDDRQNWWVAVRYGDGQKEAVKVKSVQGLVPTSFEDFDPFRVFKIKTNKWSSDHKFVYYQGIVEGIGGSEQGAEAARKTTIANLTRDQKVGIKEILKEILVEPNQASDASVALSDSVKLEWEQNPLRDANYELETNAVARLRGRSSTSHIATSVPENPAQGSAPKQTSSIKNTHPVIIQKQMRATENLEKENAEAEDEWTGMINASNRLSTNLFPLTNVPVWSSTTSTSYTNGQNCAEEEWNVEANLSEVESTRGMNSADSSSQAPSAVAKCHEHECQKLKQELISFKSEIFAKLAGLEKKFDIFIESASAIARSKGAHGNNTEQSGAINTTCQMSFGKVIVAGEVDLGLQVKCSETSWTTMNTCLEMTDWCIAILRGTFKDEAKFYCVCPRLVDRREFPQSFLDVATAHFQAFITRRRNELRENLRKQPDNKWYQKQAEFFEKEQALVGQLGASLADRTDNMYRGWRRKLLRSGSVLPPSEKRKSTAKPNPGGIKKKRVPKKMLTQPKLRSLSLLNENDDVEMPPVEPPPPPASSTSSKRSKSASSTDSNVIDFDDDVSSASGSSASS